MKAAMRGLGQRWLGREAAQQPDTATHDAAVPSDAILAVQGVTVRFGGVVANNNVTMWCRRGRITALLGPNGAGKTTCFNVLTGEQRPWAGSVRFDGVDITAAPTHERARLGIGRTFQNLDVVGELDVFENVRVGAARYGGYGVGAALLGLPRVRRGDRVTEQIAERALATVGLTPLAGARAAELPYGDLRRLELARALALGPRLLLLDEPAAGLDSSESQELVRALRRIRDHWGVTILLVEHDLDLVRSLADDAFVLDFGTILAGGITAEVLADPEVIEAYLGKPAASHPVQEVCGA